MSGKDRILACVEYVHKAHRGFNPEFVRLVPIMRWDDGWVPVVNPVEEFPGEGLVYWPGPKGLRLERGQAWLVELDDRTGQENAYKVHHGSRPLRQERGQPRLAEVGDRSGQEDVYWVRAGSRPVRPWEAVSVPGADDLVALRRALARRVFALTPSPVGAALIACPDRPGVWLAPFEVHVARNGAFEHGFSSGFVRLLAVDNAQFFDVTIDGARRRLVDSAALVPETLGVFAVQSDEDLIAGLGRRLRRWDAKAFEAIGMTQAALDGHARALTRVADAEPAGQDEARQEAVGALLTAGTASRESVGRLAEAIARHPAVTDVLIERLATDRRRAELESELAAHRAELEASVAREVAAGEARLAELQQQHAEVERGIQALEDELTQAVERQVEGGLPRLADHVMTRVLLAKAPAAATPLDVDSPVTVNVRELDSVEALRNATSAHALASGLDPLLAVTAAGLLLGRRCLLVGGAGAAQLSTALAQALGGERVYRVRTSPTLFSASDLLALPVAAVGTSEVAPLGDRLAEAAARPEVAVLILHGCNRAPPEGAFADLVEAVTPGAGGLSVPWTDRRGVARVARLDNRLLVIGTLVEGSTSFRVPEALATRVPLIDADRQLVGMNWSAPDAPVELTAIGDRLWEILARAEATVEHASKWQTATGEAEGGRVLRRYLGIVTAILSEPSADFESLLAMTIGRPAFERPDVMRLLGGNLTSGELQASHRRLGYLISRRVAC